MTVSYTHIGVQEFEIFGKEKKDDVTDKNTLNEVIKEAEGKVESKDYTKASKESLKAVIAEAKKVAENENATQDQVTQATVKLQEALKSLQLKITEQQNIGLKKTVTVSGTSNGEPESINDGDETTKWDSDPVSYTHLDVYKRQARGGSSCCVGGNDNCRVCNRGVTRVHLCACRISDRN